VEYPVLLIIRHLTNTSELNDEQTN
jgi:hypothetical protein